MLSFKVNDMVFIQNIGYGILMECGNLKAISSTDISSVLEKKESMYFDPDLFNSDSDPVARRKSEGAILVPNIEAIAKPIEPLVKPAEKLVDALIPPISIVKVRLEGCNCLVYAPDHSIRKHVIVPVRPLFLPALGTLNIKIEIGKTIESFKKQIFELLGLKYAHYFNVKLFTTSPTLSELNSPGKTLWQSNIKQSTTLTMTAEHGFCFDALPTNMTQFFSTPNNNLTFLALPKKPKIALPAVIALPNQTTEAEIPKPADVTSPVDVINPVQNVGQPDKKVETEKKQEINVKQQQKVLPQPHPQTEQKKIESNECQKKPQQPETLMLSGTKKMKSGKQYFEIRLDKLPTNTAHLIVGVQSKSKNQKWLFVPLQQQKLQVAGEIIKSTEAYGMSFKQNDIIGVLCKLDKQKLMRVTFFKNNVSLGVAFDGEVEQIQFVFELGSEGQISLDTRVPPPIDSYRLR